MPLLLFSNVSAKCHTVNQSHISLIPPTASVCPQASAPPWAEWTVIRLLFSTTRQRVTERQIGASLSPSLPLPSFSPAGVCPRRPRESKREKNSPPLLPPPLPAWSQRLSPLPSSRSLLFLFSFHFTNYCRIYGRRGERGGSEGNTPARITIILRRPFRL